jgi:hypothetical protein
MLGHATPEADAAPTTTAHTSTHQAERLPMVADVFREWAKEYIGLGHDLTIRYGRQTANGLVWHELSHSDFDGIGGLAHLMRSLKRSPARLLPTINPAYWGCSWRQRLAVIWKFTTAKAPLASPSPLLLVPAEALAQSAHGRNLGTEILTHSQTLRVRARAVRAGVTVNSLLLSALAEVVARILPPGTVQAWSVPVNLRGAIAVDRDVANHISFLFPVFARDCDPAAVHAVMQAELRSGAVELYYRFMASTPPKYRRPLANRGAHVTGIFSNLGDWSAVAPEEQAPWVFCPPAIPSQPLAAGVVTVAGRLSLMLRACSGAVHAALAAGGVDAAQWRRQLLGDEDATAEHE